METKVDLIKDRWGLETLQDPGHRWICAKSCADYARCNDCDTKDDLKAKKNNTQTKKLDMDSQLMKEPYLKGMLVWA